MAVSGCALIKLGFWTNKVKLIMEKWDFDNIALSLYIKKINFTTLQ